MPHTLEIPTPAGSSFYTLEEGRPLFVLGPNGSGKSALLSRIVTLLPQDQTHFVVAYRDNFFSQEEIAITDQAARDAAQNAVHEDRQDTARYRGATSQIRLQAPIVRLRAQENAYNSKIAAMLRQRGGARSARQMVKDPSPLQRLNRVLSKGAIRVRLSLDDTNRLTANAGALSYSFSRMSDGERAASILASTVISAEPGTVFVVDEPERHLHRSIISPLLSALFEERPDCYFVVATHESALPVDLATDAILVRDATWHGERVISWNIRTVNSSTSLPEDILRDLLGARNTILYVEGTKGSLDVSLYNLLFPNVTVDPKGSSTDVDRSVKTLRANSNLHRVSAFGLIDRDHRTNRQVAALRARGVFALRVHSVESLYYCSISRTAVAEHQARILNVAASGLKANADAEAIREFSKRQTIDQLTTARAHQTLNDAFRKLTPSKSAMQRATGILSASTASPLPAEQATYQAHLAVGDVDALVARYKIRSSGVRIAIARALGFNSYQEYERDLRNLVAADSALAKRLRTFLNPLSTELRRARP